MARMVQGGQAPTPALDRAAVERRAEEMRREAFERKTSELRDLSEWNRKQRLMYGLAGYLASAGWQELIEALFEAERLAGELPRARTDGKMSTAADAAARAVIVTARKAASKAKEPSLKIRLRHGGTDDGDDGDIQEPSGKSHASLRVRARRVVARR